MKERNYGKNIHSPQIPPIPRLHQPILSKAEPRRAVFRGLRTGGQPSPAGTLPPAGGF